MNKVGVLFLDRVHREKSDSGAYTFAYQSGESFVQLTHRTDGHREGFLKNTLHRHGYYELELVYGGEGTQLLGTKRAEMKRGYICLRTPLNLHSTLQNDEKPLLLYNVAFPESLLPKGIFQHSPMPESTYWDYYGEEELKEALYAFERLQNELISPDAYTLISVKSILASLLVTLIRRSNEKGSEAPASGEHVDKMLRYISEHYKESVRLEDIAAQMYLTPNYLGKLFAEKMGMPCAKYVEDLRFSLALQLLLNTALSVSAIAEECGFRSCSYFIRRFKERYGVPPLRYRAQDR